MLSGIAFGLTDTENEIHVITNRYRYDDPNKSLPSDEIIKKVHVHRIWTSRFGRGNLIGRSFDYLSFYIFSFFKLLVITKKNDVVVAKTDPPMISVICLLVCKLKKAKLINWLQDLFPEVAKVLGIKIPGFVYRFIIYLRNITLRKAEMNVAIGHLMAARIKDYGIPENKITVITNWADSSVIYPVDHKDNFLRKEWNLVGKFVIGYSGNIGRSHDFSGVIEAAELLKDNKDIVFLFVGDGAQKKELEDISRKKQLNILFKPYQPTEILAESISVSNIHLVTLKPELEGLIVPSKIYGILAANRRCIFIGNKDGEIAKMIQDQYGKSISNVGSEIKGAILNQMKNNTKFKLIESVTERSLDKSIENWKYILS